MSRINDSNITDLTDDLDAGQTHGMTNNFPHLADPVFFKSRVENSAYNMNRIGDNNGDGVYTAGQFMDRYPTTEDFEANMKHPVSSYSDNPQEMKTVNNMYQNSQMKPNEEVPDNVAQVNKADQVQRQGIREKFLEMFYNTLVIQSSVGFTSHILDGGAVPSVLTAIMKQQTTERARKVLLN